MGATGEWWNLLHNKSLYDGAFFFYRIIKVLLYFPNKNEYFRQMFKGAKKGIELYKNEKKSEDIKFTVVLVTYNRIIELKKR